MRMRNFEPRMRIHQVVYGYDVDVDATVYVVAQGVAVCLAGAMICSIACI